MAYSITIKTEQYQFSHGKKPAGSKQWAFQLDDSPVLMVSKPRTLYSQAIKEARKISKLMGYRRITVLP